MPETQKTKNLKVKDVIGDLPKISANPKPNNYNEKNEIGFNNQKTFGKNISEISYNKLLSKSNKHYLKLINYYQGKKIKTPFLFNHKLSIANFFTIM